MPFYGRTIVNLRWIAGRILQKYSLVYVLYTVSRMPLYTVTYSTVYGPYLAVTSLWYGRKTASTHTARIRTEYGPAMFDLGYAWCFGDENNFWHHRFSIEVQCGLQRRANAIQSDYHRIAVTIIISCKQSNICVRDNWYAICQCDASSMARHVRGCLYVVLDKFSLDDRCSLESRCTMEKHRQMGGIPLWKGQWTDCSHRCTNNSSWFGW